MTHYQLCLHADRLKTGWFGRRPIPYAVVTLDDGTELGQTENCEPTIDPDWCRSMKIEFDSQDKFPFKVTISDSRDDRKLTEAEFEANEVYASAGHMMRKGEENGIHVYVDIHKAIQGPFQGTIDLQLRGLDIKNVEPGLLGLGRSDPFFEISKKNVDHASGVVRWNTVYRSEHIDNHLNPFWDDFRIGLEELCYCDLDWPLKIAVYDWESSGKHRPIGEFCTSTRELIERIAVKGNADREQAFDLVLDKKEKLKGLVCVLKAGVTLERAEEQATTS